MLEQGKIIIDIYINGNRTKTAQINQFIEIYFGDSANVPYKTNYILPSSIYAVNQTSIPSLEIDKFGKGRTYQDLRFSKLSEKTYNTNESIDFSFAPKIKSTNETVYVGMSDTSSIGTVSIKRKQEFVSVTGIAAPTLSTTTSIVNKSQSLSPSGFSNQVFSTPLIWNFTKTVSVSGAYALAFGSTTIYNLKQIVTINGINAASFGTPYLFGGVRWINANGFNSQKFGEISVVNTTANREISLSGITPPSLGSPIVNPRTIYAKGLSALEISQPLVQRSPMPKGDDHAAYGMPTIWYRVRPLFANGFESFDSGYPKAFDPTQIVYVSPQQSTALFGDTSIKNNRRIIDVSGFNELSVSQWLELQAKNRIIGTIGNDVSGIGNAEIWNATPSIQPKSFTGEFGTAFVSSKIRYVSPVGIDTLSIGTLQVERTPSFAPTPFTATLFGVTVLSHKNRQLFAVGFSNQEFGGLIVWNYQRRVEPTSDDLLVLGKPTLTHGIRELIVQGVNLANAGTPWISFKQRYIEVVSISSDGTTSSNHRVSRNIVISPVGFVASLFGERVIPVEQDVYPKSFTGEFGTALVDLKTKYVSVNGFVTTFDQIKKEQVQFGAVLVFNKRQYIVQQFDGDNGLVPLPLGAWTLVENRNKTITTFGVNSAKFGNAFIENTAFAILPTSIASNDFGNTMVAFSERAIAPESIEPTPMSHWHIAYNDARVVATSGFTGEFGSVSLVNTRRYYQRVGNWDSQALGTPMIAYRVRSIDIESRYTIMPPYIDLPKVENLTHYVEVQGFSADGKWVSAVGVPHLAIHWNIIAPRWTLKDFIGEPFVWNKTPEVKLFGHDSVEFGSPHLRTQWREVAAIGDNANSFGLHKISDTKQGIKIIGGIGEPVFSQYHKLTKGQSPPYSLQYIEVGEFDNNNGSRFGLAGINQNVLYVQGFLSQKFGDAFVWSNNLLIKYGIAQQQEVGTPTIRNQNNYIIVEGINVEIKVGKPGIKLQTIYPRHDWDNQLVSGWIGWVTVENQHRTIYAYSGDMLRTGTDHSIDLQTRYILTKGIRPPYFGIPMIPFVPQNVTVKGFENFSGGVQEVHYPPYMGTQKVSTQGFDGLSFGNSRVELKNREVAAIGFDALRMGARKSDDMPYMWQGLRIGEHVPFQLDGFDSSAFGDGMISLKIRELLAAGFDTLTMDYDSKYFAKRMQVRLAEQINLDKSVAVIGSNDSAIGVHGVKHRQYFIRPDGNSETFRKGAGVV